MWLAGRPEEEENLSSGGSRSMERRWREEEKSKI